MIVRVALAVAALGLVAVAYVLFVRQPSNQRQWEYGMDTLSSVSVRGSTVDARNVRDFRWTPDGPSSSDYVERTFDADRISRVWFIQEPFTMPPLTGVRGIAHTYFVFDFEDQAPVAISVEARRERGETYDAARGLFNEYELIYIWGTEQDLTASRAVREKHQLYMYPLSIPNDSARALFLELAQVTQQLETQPRFYNSLTSNCTNELAKVANMVKPDAIPPNIALVLPGYADDVLYDLGFIASDEPLDELRHDVFITDQVVADYARDDFSSRLREYLRASLEVKG